MAFEFPFERAAMCGEIPAGLDLIDTGACHRLAGIYKKMHDAGKTDSALHKARLEKEALRRDWEFERKGAAQIAQIWKETELAVSACRRNPTVENAIHLCDALHGLPTCGSDVGDQNE